jgi:opacity protein-like surface antigen
MGTSRGWSWAGRLMVAAVAIAVCAQAGAAMPGLYFAGFYMDSTLAYATADAKLPGFDAAMQSAWAEVNGEVVEFQSEISDKTDIGYSFALGYQFNEYLTAEVAYLDMGTVHHQSIGVVTAGQSVYTSNTYMSAKTKGPMLSAIAVWPLGEAWAVDARAGMLFGSTKVKTALYADQLFIDEISDSDNKNSVVLSAGINWAMSPGTAIRAGYQRMDKAMIGDYDVSAWTLGLKYAW